MDLVFETLKLVGALNANVARLGAHTEDADLYEERWQAMDEDVTTLLTRLTDRWTRDEPPEAQG